MSLASDFVDTATVIALRSAYLLILVAHDFVFDELVEVARRSLVIDRIRDP